MGLLELLKEFKRVVGHGYVRWGTSDTGEIVIYTGLTARDKDGKVNPDLFDDLQQTAGTRAFMEMGD